MIGLGALANARHDPGTTSPKPGTGRWARGSCSRATGEVYGVLADALTQLGEPEAATVAVQRMLDTKPGVVAFTRASYDLELHSQVHDARLVLQRALRDAYSPATIAFCHYLPR